MPIQRPTCEGIRVRSPHDAHVIFHGVALGILPMITRRLDTEERRAITSGCVFVWEERGGHNAEPMGLGIERWTDSIRWGPSRVREVRYHHRPRWLPLTEFLFYHEKESSPVEIDMSYDSDVPSPLGYGTTHVLMRENLIKQTYSVFVETPNGRRKWHLIAYFTQDTVDFLRSVDDLPYLASIRVPPNMYKSARSANRTARTRSSDQQYLYGSSTVNRSQPHVVATGIFYNPTSPRRVQEMLAPLEYLENVPPLRRHPIDEKALMSFVPGLS
ncbi:Gti1/Pac2 family-domain-containing protein [Mycena albidolilacea]|uniref:Gti1/Pac2 family-domain-containing protein n=1 Tax=Mycena albidolilacea TaxID=1033008 RepID=A0AAD7EVU7_9AGAR|nr:Gti1/Pac2 family-domain-containing protein [Mycena albidolilacea]